MSDTDERDNAAQRILEHVTIALVRMDLHVGRMSAHVELPPKDDPLWAYWRDFARMAIVTYSSHLEGQEHRYLSTSCLHGEHGYCQSNTGAQGDKIPAVCKFCGAGCICPCHEDTGTVTVGQAEEQAKYEEDSDTPVCMATPPGKPGEEVTLPDGRTYVWGDCDCTRPRGHEGDHACEPCTQRYGAPSWPQENSDDPNPREQA